MKIEIDDDIADAIVLKSLKSYIKLVKADLKHSDEMWLALNKKDWESTLAALESVYDFYGGNL